MASPGVLQPFEFNAMYVHSLQQGDPSTEKHFVAHFGPILLRKLRRKLRSTELAQDLKQETFLRVLSILRSKQGVRQPERFEILVLAVCNNVLLETYRQQKRVVQMQPEFDLASNAPSPDACAISDETGKNVRKLLSRLDPKVRAILQAAFLEEQDREEICVRFGVTRSYLRLLLYRAKKTFGACAKEEVPGKTGLRARQPRKSRLTARPQPAVAYNAAPCSVPVFLPAQNRNDLRGSPCWQ
jgi:RNA polymerase sigma-70 factor, ECF subfamily